MNSINNGYSSVRNYVKPDNELLLNDKSFIDNLNPSIKTNGDKDETIDINIMAHECINNSTLKIDLIDNGRDNYNKCYYALQAADIYFTMTNVDTGLVKILNAPCYIKLKENQGCVETYSVCYDWKKRDTKEKGTYEGTFNIVFGDDLTSDTTTFPSGNMYVPIAEKLEIIIK